LNFSESRKISFKGDSFESRLNELCILLMIYRWTLCLFIAYYCYMYDILNSAMLNRISEKEIILVAEDTIDCIPYVKKKVLKVLSNNDDYNLKLLDFQRKL